MYSTNLSKLMVNDYFFELIKEEKIHFDWIISDFHFEKPQSNFILFNSKLDTLLLENKIKKSDHICVILDQLPMSLLWNEIFWYENIIFICPFSGISSIGHKISPEGRELVPFWYANADQNSEKKLTSCRPSHQPRNRREYLWDSSRGRARNCRQGLNRPTRRDPSDQ